jgi:hypothetical protein
MRFSPVRLRRRASDLLRRYRRGVGIVGLRAAPFIVCLWTATAILPGCGGEADNRRVRVKDDTGAPLRQVELMLLRSRLDPILIAKGKLVRVRTDSDGWLPLDRGDGWRTGRLTDADGKYWFVDLGPATGSELVLERVGEVAVRVEDEEGRGVPQARIKLIDLNSIMVPECDDDGIVLIKVPMRSSAKAWIDSWCGGKRKTVDILGAGVASSQSVVLEGADILQVQWSAVAGRGATAKFAIYDSAGARMREPWSVEQTIAGRGLVAFKCMPSGVGGGVVAVFLHDPANDRYWLERRLRGHSTVEAKWSEGARLSGKLVLPPGSIYENAFVQIERDDGVPIRSGVDSGGDFSIGGIPPGKWRGYGYLVTGVPGAEIEQSPEVVIELSGKDVRVLDPWKVASRGR